MNPFVTNLETENAIKIVGRVEALRRQGRDIISLAAGQPDMPTPPLIVAAAEKAHRDHRFGYTASAGILPLREAVAADVLARHGSAVSPEQVLIVPGGKVTMTFAMMILGMAGTEIIYPDPGFPIYHSVIAASGATAVPWLGTADNQFTAETLAPLLTERTRLVIVNSPHNPTGSVIPKAELDKIVALLAQRPDCYILSDEIYSTLCFTEAPFTSLMSYEALKDRVILLDGWSKRFAMTGWRLGYGVWPQALFPLAERLAINLYSCVNAPAQYAGLAALTQEVPQERVLQETFSRRNTETHTAITRNPQIRCVPAEGAFYLFPELPEVRTNDGHVLTSSQIEARLLAEYGLALVSGTSFGQRGRKKVRLSTAASDTMLAQGVQRLEAFLSDYAPA